MPSRLCIGCSQRPAMAGRSRCTHCASYGPRGPRHHDSVHTRLAAQVVKAAGGAIGGTCELCGQPGTPRDPLEGGHITPASQGGANIKANYRAEHRSHNRAAGAQLTHQTKTRFSPER